MSRKLIVGLVLLWLALLVSLMYLTRSPIYKDCHQTDIGWTCKLAGYRL